MTDTLSITDRAQRDMAQDLRRRLAIVRSGANAVTAADTPITAYAKHRAARDTFADGLSGLGALTYGGDNGAAYWIRAHARRASSTSSLMAAAENYIAAVEKASGPLPQTAAQ